MRDEKKVLLVGGLIKQMRDKRTKLKDAAADESPIDWEQEKWLYQRANGGGAPPARASECGEARSTAEQRRRVLDGWDAAADCSHEEGGRGSGAEQRRAATHKGRRGASSSNGGACCCSVQADGRYRSAAASESRYCHRGCDDDDRICSRSVTEARELWNRGCCRGACSCAFNCRHGTAASTTYASSPAPSAKQ